MSKAKYQGLNVFRIKSVGYRGSALVVTISILGIILIASLSMALTAVREQKASLGSGKSTVSYQAADEGVEHVMNLLLKTSKSSIVESDGAIEISSVFSGNGCSGNKKIEKSGSYSVELIDINGAVIDCDSGDDISGIATIKSVGFDSASSQTQRSINAKVVQKDPNILLLLHMDGVDGASNFSDSSRIHFAKEASTTAENEDSVVEFGSSAEFQGSNDEIDFPDSDIWDFGTDDFTIDFWINFQSNGVGDSRFLFQTGDSNGVVMKYDNSDWEVVLTGSNSKKFGWLTYAADTWYHIALVRYNDMINIYVDGTRIGSDWDTSVSPINIAGTTGGIKIGEWNNNFKGYMDELRIYKGAAWTGDFTPPAESY